jgi:hypothetical protein
VAWSSPPRRPLRPGWRPQPDDPLEWFHAAGFSQRVLRLTAEELTTLRRKIFELMMPFLHRARDEVVEGALLVDAAIFLTPRR